VYLKKAVSQCQNGSIMNPFDLLLYLNHTLLHNTVILKRDKVANENPQPGSIGLVSRTAEVCLKMGTAMQASLFWHVWKIAEGGD